MKRQNLFLLINFIILLVIGVLFVVVNDSVTLKDPEDKLFGQKIELVNGQKLASIPNMSANSTNFDLIDYKWIAKDKNDKTIGFVYHAVIKNDFNLTGSGVDYGFIELLVGITLEGNVSVEYITIYQSQWAIVGIQKFIQDSYQEIPYQKVTTIPSFDADIVSGATEKPATVSTDAIKSLVEKVVALHYDLATEDPYEEIFGTDQYELSVDASFITTEHIIKKQLVTDGTDSLGYIFSVSGRGEYQNGAFDSIVIELIFGTDNKIIGILLPEETYKHSSGGFKDKIEQYLLNFIGLTSTQIKGIVLDNVDSDVTAGASNTRVLVDQLLSAFVNEYIPTESGPYDEMFGKTNLIVANADAFIPTAHIIGKQIISDGANTLGYIYSVSGNGEYRNTFFDSIVLELIVGVDNKIVGIQLPEETYKHSTGNWKDKNDTYILNFIGLSINEIQGMVNDAVASDVTSGASNTRALIDDLLEAFVSEVN